MKEREVGEGERNFEDMRVDACLYVECFVCV